MTWSPCRTSSSSSRRTTAPATRSSASHKPTGIRPRFWEEARAWGLEAQLGAALGFGEGRS